MGTPDTTDRVLYSVREFCRRNSIGKTTFFALVKSGAVVTVKVGTRTLVPASSEKAWHNTLVASNSRVRMTTPRRPHDRLLQRD